MMMRFILAGGVIMLVMVCIVIGSYISSNKKLGNIHISEFAPECSMSNEDYKAFAIVHKKMYDDDTSLCLRYMKRNNN